MAEVKRVKLDGCRSILPSVNFMRCSIAKLVERYPENSIILVLGDDMLVLIASFLGRKAFGGLARSCTAIYKLLTPQREFRKRAWKHLRIAWPLLFSQEIQEQTGIMPTYTLNIEPTQELREELGREWRCYVLDGSLSRYTHMKFHLRNGQIEMCSCTPLFPQQHVRFLLFECELLNNMKLCISEWKKTESMKEQALIMVVSKDVDNKSEESM